MTDLVNVEAGALSAFVQRIFGAAGVPDKRAAIWAESLVWANLRGMDSHGVLRVPYYLKLMSTGEIAPAAEMRVLQSAGAIALLDAARAPGPIGMGRAMELAIERARQVHCGWCVARNITHCGAVGLYARAAADAGMIGVVTAASLPLMAYHGSKRPVLSTNPIAIAIPAARRQPLVLDMATSEVAFGKILAHRATGKPIPDGWGLDEAGQPTTDAEKVATLTPMSGAKGSGLSLMIECIASLLAGNPVIAPVLNGAPVPGMNATAVALDIAAFGDRDAFLAEVDALADAIAAQPRQPDVDQLYMPGERGDAEAALRRRNGIALPMATWDALAKAARRAGVELPPRKGVN